MQIRLRHGLFFLAMANIIIVVTHNITNMTVSLVDAIEYHSLHVLWHTGQDVNRVIRASSSAELRPYERKLCHALW